ncbi:MAG: calcium-binding protein, partial [Bacteroidota bacterium]
GGGGNDLYLVGVTAAGALEDTVTEGASAGTDTIQLQGSSTNATAATITRGAELEILEASGTNGSLLNLTGNTAANVLTGNAAGNVITGAGGADTQDGREGSDIYLVSVLADYTGDVIADTGTAGTDELRFADTVAGTLTVSANTSGLERIVIGTGTAATAVTTGTTAINVNASALTTGVAIVGNAGANVLTGGSGTDTLNGGAGNDTLVGGAGSDTLNGGAGTDTMQGGAGDDVYVVDATTDVVTEAVGEGTDRVEASVTFTLGANVENLTLTGTTAINGTGNALGNVLTGNSGNNVLTGGDGDDVLNGGLGADTLTGGAGIDTASYADATAGVTVSLVA